MKRSIKILLAFPLFLFIIYSTSCDYVENPIVPLYGDIDTSLFPGPGLYIYPQFDATFPSNSKNVLIEDYTGHTCGNCPDAAVLAHDLKEANPGSVFVSSVHASIGDGFQDINVPGDEDYPKYNHDFRTEAGNEYVEDINGFIGNPQGMVNRVEYIEGTSWQFKSTWTASVQDILNANDPLQMNLQVKTNYYTETRGLFIHVQSKTLEALNGSYSMVVALQQNEYIDWQKDYSFPPSQQDIEFYPHKDVFLGTINGSYGTLLFNGDSPTDETFESHYSYEVPESIEIEGSNDGEDTGLSIIAYLMNNDTYEIIQVVEVHVPITY